MLETGVAVMLCLASCLVSGFIAGAILRLYDLRHLSGIEHELMKIRQILEERGCDGNG